MVRKVNDRHHIAFPRKFCDLCRVFAGGLLIQAQQLAAMNKAPLRDQKSMRNYMENHACLVEEEASFVYDTEDLITLRPGRDCSIVDAFVEKMLRVFNCKPLQVSFFEHHLCSLAFINFGLCFANSFYPFEQAKC